MIRTKASIQGKKFVYEFTLRHYLRFTVSLKLYL